MRAVVLRDTKRSYGMVELVACQNGTLLATGQHKWRYAVRTPEMSTQFTLSHQIAQGWYDLISNMTPTKVLNSIYDLENK
jgi:hypothetical protein